MNEEINARYCYFFWKKKTTTVNIITEEGINSQFKLNNKASNVILLSLLLQFTNLYILSTCLYCEFERFYLLSICNLDSFHETRKYTYPDPFCSQIVIKTLVNIHLYLLTNFYCKLQRHNTFVFWTVDLVVSRNFG